MMLKNLSKQIRDCYQQAEDCARKATAQTDPRLRQDYLNLEQRWLLLARSCDFTQRLTDFSNEVKRWKADELPIPYTCPGCGAKYQVVTATLQLTRRTIELLSGGAVVDFLPPREPLS